MKRIEENFSGIRSIFESELQKRLQKHFVLLVWGD